MDRIKRLDSQNRLLKRQVAVLREERGEKAAMVAGVEGALCRLSGEVDEANREREAWCDRASALQQKLVDTTAALAIGGEGGANSRASVIACGKLLMSSGRLMLCAIGLIGQLGGREGECVEASRGS
jgi:hypothetical protein